MIVHVAPMACLCSADVHTGAEEVRVHTSESCSCTRQHLPVNVGETLKVSQLKDKLARDRISHTQLA